jgi:integrase/recombinase XerD
MSNRILNRYLEKYIDYLKYEKKLSNNTIKSYFDNLYVYDEYIKNNNLDLFKISKNDIDIFLQSLSISSKSKAHYITVLRSLYNYFLDLNYIKISPLEGIKLPRVEKKLPEYLTIEEVSKILDINLKTPLDYRNKAMLELMYATGIRITELLDLKLSDIDYKEDLIRVYGKGSKERIIPVTSITMKYLNEYINNQRKFILKTKTSEYVFVNNYGGRMSRQGFFKILKSIVKSCHIDKDVSPHTIRHSFATHLLNNGADLRVIQELLGHSDISTTEIYTHISKEKIKDDYNLCHPHSKE